MYQKFRDQLGSLCALAVFFSFLQVVAVNVPRAGADDFLLSDLLPVMECATCDLIIPEFPWEVTRVYHIVTVTDNSRNDYFPVLSNGHAFWLREKGDTWLHDNDIIYWKTSQDVSTAHKINTHDLSHLVSRPSAYNDTVAIVSFPSLEYWDGSSWGVIDNNAIRVSLYGDSIAYEKNDGHDSEIILKKGLTESHVTNNSVTDSHPSIFGNMVAWEEDDGHDMEIYYWDGTTTTKLTDNTVHDERPSLYDGKIAWQRLDGGDYEIYYWNGSNIIQITNDDKHQKNPSLYDGKIAFMGFDGTDYEIYYWNGESILQITKNDENDAEPCLDNGSIIWKHFDGNDYEIQYAVVDPPRKPTAATTAATDVSQTTANLNGSVNPNGQDTTYHFEWGSSTSYGHDTSTENAGSGRNSQAVYAGLTGLTPGTTYHFRLVATNASGTSQGGDRTFTTQALAVAQPTAVTGTALNLTDKSVRLTGTVNPHNAPTQVRFDYGTSPGYGSHTPWFDVGSGGTDLNVATDRGGLSASTTYHYRIVARNSGGTVNGSDMTFTTEAAASSSSSGSGGGTASTSTDIAERFSGWWYNKNEGGTGLAMEIQDDKVFLAWFVYDDQGRTCWYTSGGKMANETTYVGTAQKWSGWPWGQAYGKPVPETVGTITIILNKGDTDSISFTAGGDGLTTSRMFKSFMADFSPGEKDSRDLTGWWYSSDYDGMGFFIDARGGKLAMVWYNYRDDKSPRWWTSNGDFADGAQTYTGTLDGWKNGQCPECTYHQPEQMPGDGGNISIAFTDSSHAAVAAGGVSFNIQRFEIP